MRTAERVDVTYRTEGRYKDDALAEISRFLRDWRSGEVFTIDPHTIDILANIQGHFGRSEPLYVTSGYRTQSTNLLLASMGYEVARNSYHLHGKAVDFFMPGVDLDGMRSYATQLQAGGVGYYPRDAFLHVDCGPLRTWTGNQHRDEEPATAAAPAVEEQTAENPT